MFEGMDVKGGEWKMPRLDLPGPSKPIRVEPVEEPGRRPVEVPGPEEPGPEPDVSPERDREPAEVPG